MFEKVWSSKSYLIFGGKIQYLNYWTKNGEVKYWVSSPQIIHCISWKPRNARKGSSSSKTWSEVPAHLSAFLAFFSPLPSQHPFVAFAKSHQKKANRDMIRPIKLFLRLLLHTVTKLSFWSKKSGLSENWFRRENSKIFDDFRNQNIKIVLILKIDFLEKNGIL